MQRIIDSHAHIGKYGEWNCGVGFLLSQMDKAGIGLAVVGDLAGNSEGAASVYSALDAIRPFRDRMRLMLWVNPSLSDLHAAQALLESEREMFACVKAHPQTAGVPLGDSYAPYLELCRAFNLPFVSHTERNGYADIDLLAKMAEQNPDVDFIAVHMELHSNHQRAIELIASHGNLYGDTTFVPVSDVVTAVERCGADKILFGTDAPVIGESCFDSLPILKDPLIERFGRESADMILCKNCDRLMLQTDAAK